VTFNKKITIQKYTETRDSDGYPSKQWIDFFSCWAYVNGISNNEFIVANAETAQNIVNFTVRYCKTLENVDTKGYRIVFQGKYYDIQGVDNFEFNNMSLKFRAVEGVNDG